jgi:hypothetical protein
MEGSIIAIRSKPLRIVAKSEISGAGARKRME